MPSRRPVHLNLFVIRLPVGGVVSILHRVSGVLLAFALPAFLYILQQTAADAATFDTWRDRAGAWPVRLAAASMLWLLWHHTLSGIRHLLQDLHLGIARESSRVTAWGVLALSAGGAALIAAGLLA